MKIRYSAVSTKGQIVIPSELRAALQIVPGTRVAIHREGDAIILRPVTAGFIRNLRGCFGKGKSLGQIREQEHCGNCRL
jgi:AbrB family looped-hinge helix DNA binding protein